MLYIYLLSGMQLKCLDPSFCMYCISQREWFKACRSVSKSICMQIGMMEKYVCNEPVLHTQEEAGGNGTMIYQRCERRPVSRVFGFDLIMQESRLVSANHRNEMSSSSKQTNKKTNIFFKPAWLPLNFHIYFSLFNIFLYFCVFKWFFVIRVTHYFLKHCTTNWKAEEFFHLINKHIDL